MTLQAPPVAERPEFAVMQMHLLWAVVCTSLTDIEEITRRLNDDHLCGTENGWVFAGPDGVADSPNPCPCDRWPSTHKHYAFKC